MAMDGCGATSAPKSIEFSDVVHGGLKQIEQYKMLISALREKLAPVMVPEEPSDLKPCGTCPVETPLAKYLYDGVQEMEIANMILADTINRIRL